MERIISTLFAIAALVTASAPALAWADLFVPGKTYNADVQFCTSLADAETTALRIVNGGPNGPPVCHVGRIAFTTGQPVAEHRKGFVSTRVYEVKEVNTETTLYVIVISLTRPPDTYRST